MPLPFAMASFVGFFLGLPPNPLLTMDQVQFLKQDNIIGDQNPQTGVLKDLDVYPTSIEAIVLIILSGFAALDNSK